MNPFAVNAMLKQPITFDRFIRSLLGLAVIVTIGLLINRLSSVLLPFFVAWLLAYLMYPLVRFLQYRMRLRSRTLSILVALLLVLAALVGLLMLIVPPIVGEFSRLTNLLTLYSERYFGETGVVAYIHQFIDRYVAEYESTLVNLVQEKSFMDAVQGLLTKLWGFATGTLDFALGFFSSLIVILYLFFILQDYEAISEGWIRLMPPRYQCFTARLASDVESGMNAYFRGQAMVAFCVGVLFSVGFLIVGFPMAVGLGMFMGFLNLVPYLQTLGFVPMVLLALLSAADTGQNFWWIFLPAVAVVGIVQVFQDAFLVPKIMGSAMGLNPAVILLSLSVWGSLLGFIGLIIALPLTTLLISYYRQFVLEEPTEPVATSELAEPTQS